MATTDYEANAIDDITIEDTNGDTSSSDDVGSTVVPKIARFSKTKPFSNIIHGYYEDDGRCNSICKVCRKKLSGRNPTNLENHLKSLHQKEHEKFLLEKSNKDDEEKKRRAATTSHRQEINSGTNQSIEEGFRVMADKKMESKKELKNMSKISIQWRWHSLRIFYRIYQWRSFISKIC